MISGVASADFLSGMSGVSGLDGLGKGVATGGGGFAEALQDAVKSVEGAQASADQGLRELASGQSVDLHGTMIALEEANISLRAMGSVRDKVVEGWQAVWNMQI